MKFFNKYNSDSEELNSINITPFTDCMMVLLIIFMITGTALTQAGFNINLPKTEFGDTVEESSISISLTEKGEYFLGDEKVDFKNLSVELKKKNRHKDMPVLIYADSKVYYEKVMSIVDVVKNSGFSNVSLLVDKQQIDRG